MKFTVIRDTTQLAACRSQWERLNLKSPYQSFEWINNWCRNQETEQQELCFIVWQADHGDWIGVATFCLELGLGRTLRLVHPGTEFGQSNGLLALPGRHCEFADALVEWIAQPDACRELVGPIDAIVLDHVCRYDPEIEYLLGRFKEARYRVHFGKPCSRRTLALPDSFSTFEQDLAQAARDRCHEYMYFVDDQITFRSSNDLGVATLWDEFLKMRVGIEPAMDDRFADDRRIDFLRKSLFRLHDESKAEIRISYLLETPISGTILLNTDRCLQICETAISPFANLTGILEWTILETIRSAIERQFETLEFSLGEADHQSFWSSQAIPTSQIRLIPPNLVARIKHGILASGAALFGRQSTVG